MSETIDSDNWEMGKMLSSRILQLVTFKIFPCCCTEKDILKGFLVDSLSWRDKAEALRPRQLEFWECNFVEDRCLDQGVGARGWRGEERKIKRQIAKAWEQMRIPLHYSSECWNMNAFEETTWSLERFTQMD